MKPRKKFPPLPRAKKKPLSEYKALLRIDVDFGSSGIWEITEPGQRYAGTCRAYESLKLPAALVQRFDYWTSWFDAHEPWNGTPGFDTELFRAYGFSLAIDLKRVLGDDFYVEYGGREIHDDREYVRDATRKGRKQR